MPSGEKAREVTRSLCALSSLVTRSSLRPTCAPRGKGQGGSAGQGGRRWWGARGAGGEGPGVDIASRAPCRPAARRPRRGQRGCTRSTPAAHLDNRADQASATQACPDQQSAARLGQAAAGRRQLGLGFDTVHTCEPCTRSIASKSTWLMNGLRGLQGLTLLHGTLLQVAATGENRGASARRDRCARITMP